MYQLSCRAHASGRGLVPITAAGGSPDPAAAGLERWSIFIHGFNNTEKFAAATWRETSEQLQRRQVDLGSVVLFYWPGDYSKWQLVSAMNYPKTVPIAVDTAALLAAYLQRVAQDRPMPLQLSFVAHSLGSLVVLETVRLLRTARANVTVHDVLLMAAAVPEGFCMPNEEYGVPFSLETNEGVLYSLDDDVLKLTFQVGQQIADRFPDDRQRAVGRSGGPGAGRGKRWSANDHMSGFDHGDYWKNPKSLAEIARVVTSNWGLAGSGSPPGRRAENRNPLRADTLRTDVLDEDEYLPPDLLVRWLNRPIDL